MSRPPGGDNVVVVTATTYETVVADCWAVLSTESGLMTSKSFQHSGMSCLTSPFLNPQPGVI